MYKYVYIYTHVYIYTYTYIYTHIKYIIINIYIEYDMNGDIMAMHKKLDEMIPGAPSQESRVATFIGLGRGMSNLKMGSFDGYLRWWS